ncbi:GntR family transcriptional regulator [Enterococcus sp. AZ196]|uniref:GntR family transcriptional regulator n=1 Tax=Enterococcus sp. AZ196 TaxID=2774659 RepID=UPI003D2BB63B
MVVSYVKNRILAGTLKSGDRLIETDISEELMISRAPVREAMRILNQQGLVTFSPRKGNHVIEMGSAEMMEVFEIRTSLEKQTLHKILRKQLLKEEDLRRLTKIALDMKDNEQTCQTEEDRVFLFNTLDLTFHKYLWELSGNVRRARILENLYYQLLIAINEDISSQEILERKSEEHLAFVEVLSKNDLPTVVHEFYNHIRAYVKATLPTEEKNFYLDC